MKRFLRFLTVGSTLVWGAFIYTQVPVMAQTGPSSPTSRGGLALTEVIAPSWLESQNIYYRLEGVEQRAYAQSRWAVPPAQLVAVRARDKTDGETYLLKIELDDYSQVFETPSSSIGRVQLRATLLSNGRMLAQNSFSAGRPAPTANALGAVRALTEATESALNDLANWVESQVAPQTVSR
jgi:cholesterol transport system auxiliary component